MHKVAAIEPWCCALVLIVFTTLHCSPEHLAIFEALKIAAYGDGALLGRRDTKPSAPLQPIRFPLPPSLACLRTSISDCGPLLPLLPLAPPTSSLLPPPPHLDRTSLSPPCRQRPPSTGLIVVLPLFADQRPAPSQRMPYRAHALTVPPCNNDKLEICPLLPTGHHDRFNYETTRCGGSLLDPIASQKSRGSSRRRRK